MSTPFTDPAFAPQQRQGAVNVLIAFMLVGLLCSAAIAIDLGYLLSGREELQRTCDAAALAACWEMATQSANGASNSSAIENARSVASTFAGLNTITKEAPNLAICGSNNASGDVIFGYISDPTDVSTFDTSASTYNAVKVRVRRNAQMNGAIPFFLGPMFGKQSQDTEASAVAMLVSEVKGFQTPSNGGNLDILPFALDEDTWNDYLDGAFCDHYQYDPATGQVRAGSDGKRELNLYPQNTGSPGNRGTVDIGGSNNSTSDIARQIVDGISPGDLDDLGKPLEFDSTGELELNGDTGISAGVKDELASIIGDRRCIPIFSMVQGPGNNAQYTIVRWLGIRVMAVKLTGKMSGKKLMVQEAPIEMRGVIPSETTGTSSSIYSPAFIVN